MPVLLNSGNFSVSAALANHTRDVASEFNLEPRPSFVEYPDRVKHSFRESKGRLIKQRSLRNPDKRSWVWENYREDTPKYNDQYWTLFDMQEHINVQINSGSPYVYLKEDVTSEGLAKYDIPTGRYIPEWIRCRILLVQRSEKRQGGILVYDRTEVTFTIDDTTVDAL